MTAAYASCNDSCDAPDPIPMFLSAAGFGAGIGALAGFLVDKAHKGRELLYPRTGQISTIDKRIADSVNRSQRSVCVVPLLTIENARATTK